MFFVTIEMLGAPSFSALVIQPFSFFEYFLQVFRFQVFKWQIF